MAITIMKTEGGPHSAIQWAQTTASKIITVADTADPSRASAARKLEGELIEILEVAHNKVQCDARQHHEDNGVDVALFHPKVGSDNKTFKAILKATAASPFSDHFDKPETQDYIKAVLQQHFATVADIERQWVRNRGN